MVYDLALFLHFFVVTMHKEDPPHPTTPHPGLAAVGPSGWVGWRVGGCA